MRIGIDVDGVLRDFITAFKSVVGQEYPNAQIPESISTWKFEDDITGLSREEIESGAFDPLMFPSIPEFPQYDVDAQPIKYKPFDFTNIQAALDSVVPVRVGGTGTRFGGRIRR